MTYVRQDNRAQQDIQEKTTLKKSILKRYRTIVNTAYAGALGYFLSHGVAMASLAKLTQSSDTVLTLVKGPAGTAALLIATIGGAVTALMKGNLWLSIAVLIVGVLLGFHIDNISNIFAVQGH